MTYLILAILINTAYADSKPTVRFVDSNDDPKITFIIVNMKNKTCKIPILKTDLKQMDKVVDLVMEKCGL